VAALARVLLLLALGVGQTAVYTLLPTRIDTLAVGALVAVAARDAETMARVSRWLRPVAVVSALVADAIFVHERSFGFWNRNVQLIGYSAVCGVSGWLIADLASSSRRSWARRACAVGWLRWLGVRSYALYVAHFPLMQLLKDRWGRLPHHPWCSFATAGGRLAFAVAGIGASAGVAWFTWLAIERPCLRLKRFFPRELAPGRSSPRDVPVAAVMTLRS